MTKHINRFRGETRYLSNFYDAPVLYDGLMYRNSEAAFQAAKCLDPEQRKQFLELPPNEAKRLGRSVDLRPDWEEIKDSVMFEVCLDKFWRNPDLGLKLLDTGDAFLTEGNDWNDMYWGMDLKTGKGKNQLGKTLMQVRDVLTVGGPIPDGLALSSWEVMKERNLIDMKRWDDYWGTSGD